MKIALKYVLIFVLAYRCSSPFDDSKPLQDLINQYENYESYDSDDFPLGDHSEERYQSDYDFYKSLLDKTEKIPIENLSATDLVSLELLKFLLNDHLANFEFKTHLNPLLSDAGFHNNLVYRVRPLTTKKQAIDYLEMLESIPLYVDQNLNLLRKGIEEGVSQPLVIFEGYESSYNRHIKDSFADTMVEGRVIPTMMQYKTQNVANFKRLLIFFRFSGDLANKIR